MVEIIFCDERLFMLHVAADVDSFILVYLMQHVH